MHVSINNYGAILQWGGEGMKHFHAFEGGGRKQFLCVQETFQPPRQ